MEREEMILVKDFCLHHNMELSFIEELNNSGLLEITRVEESVYISTSQLKQLELIRCLKQDMDINVEGIETITYLLERIQELKQQILSLNNRLAFYESSGQ